MKGHSKKFLKSRGWKCTRSSRIGKNGKKKSVLLWHHISDPMAKQRTSSYALMIEKRKRCFEIILAELILKNLMEPSGHYYYRYLWGDEIHVSRDSTDSRAMFIRVIHEESLINVYGGNKDKVNIYDDDCPVRHFNYNDPKFPNNMLEYIKEIFK